MSANSFLVAPGVMRYAAAWWRVCRVARLPSVIICSTSGLAALARVSVVVMRSFSITLVTRFRRVARRCAGWRPSLENELRCRMSGFFARLEARGFLRRWRRGLAGERRPDDAAMLIELHAQTQAHLVQDFLNFIERLAAEVFRLQHLVFALLNQFPDGLDIRVLQAIVGTHGEFQFLDRAVQVFDAGIVVGLDRLFDDVGLFLEVNKDAHVVFDQL